MLEIAMKNIILSFFIVFMFIFNQCRTENKLKQEDKNPSANTSSGQDSTKNIQAAEKDLRQKTVLASQIGGRWYSNDGSALLAEIRKYLNAASVENPEKEGREIFALISPHAGYMYSGSVAAHGYKLLAGKNFKRVVVLGISHRGMYQGISIPSESYFATPAGEIPVDTAERARLLKHGIFMSRSDAYSMEHSVEIQVPFIQAQLKDFTILPLYVGRLSKEQIEKAANALIPLMTKDTLFVISSDFTHYGPNYDYVPFKENIGENLKKLDMGAFEKIKNLDLDGFLEYREKTGDTICGFSPIALLIAMLKDKKDEIKIELIKYDTSGKITGDFTNSVSYFSIGFLKKWNPLTFQGVKFIDREEEKILLELARNTLRKHLAHQDLPSPENGDIKLTEKLKEKFGVFVTLKEKGELRGCIGNIMPVKPLYQGVIDNTVNAASHDTRFSPVQPDEEKLIEIEISVLSRPVTAPGGFGDIVLGRDGIILSKNGYSAVFLPQVAPEQSWNLEQTLSHLSRKAGLSADAWKEGAEFDLFSAHVFNEK
jgi:AmmeMemoRadiSam system protein B/AmmeMemoRadiSam system protein A